MKTASPCDGCVGSFHSGMGRRRFLAATTIALLGASSIARSQPLADGRIGILYAPSNRFQAIIDAAIKGIEAAATGRTLERRALRPGASAEEIASLLDAPVAGWLLLGSEAWSAAQRVPMRQPAVTGLQYASPDQAPIGAVSLDFDPAAFLPELKFLLPRHNRLSPVFRRGRDDWIIDRLREVAPKQGFAIAPAAASNLGEATDHLSGMLRYGNPSTDIIWILGGGDLVTTDTAAHLFQQAYNARFPTFSDRRAWVEEGALLSGEPDYRDHGEQMVRVLIRMIETRKPRFELSARVSFALNVRVARRIGVSVTDDIRRRMGALVADE